MQAKIYILIHFWFLFFKLNAQELKPQSDTAGCRYYLTNGREFYYKEDYLNAEKMLSKAFKCNSNTENIEGQLAYCNYKLKNYSQAVSFATMALNKNPADDIALQVRGWSYYSLLMYEQCVQDLEQEKLNSYKNPFSNVCKSASYFELGNFDKAYEESHKGLLLSPDDARLLLTNGASAYKLSLFEESSIVLSKVIEIWKDRPLPYFYLGAAFFRLNKYEDAIKNLIKSVNNNFKLKLSTAEQVDAEFYIGTGYFQLGQYQKAIPFFLQTFGYDSSNIHPYQLLGFSYLGIDSLNKAKYFFERGKEKFPNEGIFYYGLANVYSSQINLKNAKKYLDTAFSMTSLIYDSIAYFQKLSDAFLAISDTITATKCVEKIIRYFPDSPTGYENKLRILLENKSRYKDELRFCINKLSQIYTKNKELSAYFEAQKAQLELEWGYYEASLLSINLAIKKDSFPEYFALRSICKFKKNQKEQIKRLSLSIPKNLQTDILKDINTALSKNSQDESVNLLKAAMLVKFNLNSQACEYIKKVEFSDISKGTTIKQDICTGKKIKTEDPRNLYKLSGFNNRFLNK